MRKNLISILENLLGEKGQIAEQMKNIKDKSNQKELKHDLIPLREQFIAIMLNIFKRIDNERLKKRLSDAVGVKEDDKFVLKTQTVSESEVNKLEEKHESEKKNFEKLWENTVEKISNKKS